MKDIPSFGVIVATVLGQALVAPVEVRYVRSKWTSSINSQITQLNDALYPRGSSSSRVSQVFRREPKAGWCTEENGIQYCQNGKRNSDALAEAMALGTCTEGPDGIWLC